MKKKTKKRKTKKSNRRNVYVSVKNDDIFLRVHDAICAVKGWGITQFHRNLCYYYFEEEGLRANGIYNMAKVEKLEKKAKKKLDQNKRLKSRLRDKLL